MSQSQVRSIVALMIIFGHISVFIFGFFLLGVLVEPFNADTLQIILMASPVLGASAVVALKYILQEESDFRDTQKVRISFALVSISMPAILICAIFILFLMTYYRINNFSVDSLKIALGLLETFFAVFMTAISDKLFGKATPSQATVPEFNSKNSSDDKIARKFPPT